ncbi:MAG: ATP-dependent helicase [bacterium]|nr:ATP-dependent helicase [bacterium]
MFQPRPKQAEVLNYSGGKMGVSAVPGSGKTKTLSYLAAQLVASKNLNDDQEVLVVTLVNSAVDNFARQVAEFVKARGLLPNFGYRVRTLHGLANDIVRERPALVGLQDGFQIVDEREAEDILQDAVTAWTRMNPYAGEPYLDRDLDENRAQAVLRDQWPGELLNMARAFIKQAKDLQLTPDDVRRGLDRFGQPLPLAEMCHAIYVSYQRGLNYRGAVDFQDLIRLALRALELDADYLKRLRQRWPYILEDEAQDSSQLQEKIIRLLAGDKGNWVRVGDPNQAIYETFTTANPEFLRRFLTEKGVKARELPNSGRSSRSIIDLANFLIDWSLTRHPVEAVREKKPLQPPHIEPAPTGDPQPNPADDPTKVILFTEDFGPEDEIAAVVRSIVKWLPDNADKTCAVLVPRNDRGAQVVRGLKARNIPVVELLQNTSSTREAAGALVFVLEALTIPNAAPPMSMAFKVWRREDRTDRESNARLEQVVKALASCRNVEEYLWPRAGNDWLESETVNDLTGGEDGDLIREQLVGFRALMRRWQAAVVLPIDQLILTLAQDLFDTAADLAIAHSLAVFLGQQGNLNPHWRLPEFVGELKLVAQNKRRVMDLSEDATGYDADKHKGAVTVTTMHKAKGLEWDRVYLMSVNSYDFPSAEPQDRFIGEKWFIRDHLDLQAEALAQLRTATDTLTFAYEEGAASDEARVNYAAERLRLLYVGITRARRELVLTWNTGRDGSMRAATPFIALQTYWESRL